MYSPFIGEFCRMQTTTVVERAAAGDAAAWNELKGEYERTLRGIAHWMRVRPHDAEDAAQTTWLALWEHAATIREPASVGAWLACVMRRRCLALLQERRRELPTDDVDGWTAPAAPPPQTGPGVADELTTVLWRLVDGLPPRERTVIRALFDGSDRSYREIADELGMPIGAIGPVRMRALTHLASRLAEVGITADVLSVMD